MKRTPLKRSIPLKRTGIDRGRSGLRPVSARRQKIRRQAQPVVDAVMVRDGGCVLRDRRDLAGTCYGPLTPHHLRKQGRGGLWTADNLVTLCSHHNGTWVEDHPHEAWAVGLVVLTGETTRQAWRSMRTAGLAVGPLVVECPGSGLAPEGKARAGWVTCMACGYPAQLGHDPSGWGGPVVADHAKEPW